MRPWGPDKSYLSESSLEISVHVVGICTYIPVNEVDGKAAHAAGTGAAPVVGAGAGTGARAGARAGAGTRA